MLETLNKQGYLYTVELSWEDGTKTHKFFGNRYSADRWMPSHPNRKTFKIYKDGRKEIA